MQGNLDNELDSFRKELTDDDLGYRGKRDTARGPRSPFPFKPKRSLLILAGAGILLLIILVAIFSGNDKEPAAQDLSATQARLDQLEERINQLERIETTLVETAKTEASLSQQLQNLDKRFDLLEKKIAVGQEEAQASAATQQKPSPLKKGRYHEVRPGDTLFQIAERYDTTIDKLCRLNNISPKDIIHPGQRLLVGK